MMTAPKKIGRYEIEAAVGAGGMGQVLRARDPQLGRRVAIKLLQPQLDNPGFRERFDREARAVAALSHPNIVTVYDFGNFEQSQYLVLEYIAGRTLRKVIEEREPVALPRRLRWLEELCEGLDYAHRNGIVHRDVKPENVMIDHLSHLRILDFGLALLAGAASRTQTKTTGTPMYMAPECILGHAADRRADVFAVGVIAYELVAYHPPFDGATDHVISQRVLTEDPPPFRDVQVKVDPELESTVRTALNKRPEDRYQTARDLQRQIERVRQRLEYQSVAGERPPLDHSRVTPPQRLTPAIRSLDREAAGARNPMDERAQQTVLEARRRFDRREHLAALALLRDFRPSHPEVTRALQALQLELQDVQRKARERRP